MKGISNPEISTSMENSNHHLSFNIKNLTLRDELKFARPEVPIDTAVAI
jgi:hypothetical protein